MAEDGGRSERSTRVVGTQYQWVVGENVCMLVYSYIGMCMYVYGGRSERAVHVRGGVRGGGGGGGGKFIQS